MSHGIQIAAQALPPELEKFLQAAKAAATAPPTPPSATTSPEEVRARANSAVDRCCAAYNKAYQAAKAEKKDSYSARKDAEHAFRRAMPPLDSEINLRDFVACVAHALLSDIIDQNESARLLYAVQVANSIAKNAKSPRSPGRASASAKEDPAPSPAEQSIPVEQSTTDPEPKN